MATKPEAAKPDADAPANGPPKSKKLMLIGAIAFLVLALVGGGAWFVLSKQSVADESGDVAGRVEQVEPKAPPTFLPLENMVVNLADPGGEKVAQIGITLELKDAKATDKVKVYLPSIRSGILLLISQRTAEEILLIEGKEKLAADILAEASRPFDSGNPAKKPARDPAKGKKKNAEKTADDNPVRGVHFSSFIVQ